MTSAMETSTKYKIRAIICGLVGGALCLTIVGAIIGIPLVILAVGFWGEATEEQRADGDRPWYMKSFVELYRERK